MEILRGADYRAVSLDYGLWNWLSLYFFDQLCPADEGGRRRPAEVAAYYLPSKYQYNRYYRHLIRTPWLAVRLHGEVSRVILIPVSQKGAPLATRGELAEEITSRQGLFRSPTVMSAIHALYFDQTTGRPRRRAATSTAGSARRLGQILKQFELTYDLEWGDKNLVLGLLPREFDAWRRDG